MKLIVSILIATCALASCSKRQTEEEKILEAAKRESVAACKKPNGGGCKFSVTRTPDGWSVYVEHIILSESGERVYLPGAFHSYSFDKEGKLVATFPGI